jgi:hypothetical protein
MFALLVTFQANEIKKHFYVANHFSKKKEKKHKKKLDYYA